MEANREHARQLLVQHLTEREAAEGGSTRIALSEAGHAALKALASQKGAVPDSATSSAKARFSLGDSARVAEPEPAPGGDLSAPESTTAPTPAASLTPAPAAADELGLKVEIARPTGSVIEPEGDTPAEQIEFLKQAILKANIPGSLRTLRETMVFSVGNPEADLMLVGEGPGADEEEQGEPFVGKSGMLLDKILGVMGVERSQLYISIAVKYRPMVGDGSNQRTSNRKPTPEELASCRDYLMAEIAVVRPKVILALGASAAEGLLGVPCTIGSARKEFHATADGIPVVVTYHPSYLLRNEALSERRKVWENMLMVMDKLAMPISEKQRGFFTSAKR